tara:strand:+ start:1780 stop:2292 length:513 start_codon:yes stop_codon:yes gene_type:complete
VGVEAQRILGVDTSLRSSGVGVIEVRGSQMRAVAYGRIYNRPAELHSRCLLHIFEEVSELIEAHKPDCVAIEGAFFAKNAKTAMVLGQARGAVLAACARAGLPVGEHSPRRVKQALTGSGSAQKDQVAKMVMQLLGLKEQPQEDAADALAVAITHHHQASLPEAMRVPFI